MAQSASRRLELPDAGRGTITTEILDAPQFFYAEDYHQQYLAKNPDGYCGLKGTGISCAMSGTAALALQVTADSPLR